jgi:hypothetical protein
MQITLDTTRDNLDLRKVTGCVLQEVGHQKRHVHHQTLHGYSFGFHHQ